MKKCSYLNCTKKHYALGFCRAHHINFKRNGTPEQKYDMSRQESGDLPFFPDEKGRGNKAINIVNDLKYKAKQRNKSWELTHVQTFGLITSACVYCGFVPEWPKNRVGIDRVDNNIDYIYDNCVSCCSICNTAKGQMSLADFKTWITKVYIKSTQTKK